MIEINVYEFKKKQVLSLNHYVPNCALKKCLNRFATKCTIRFNSSEKFGHHYENTCEKKSTDYHRQCAKVSVVKRSRPGEIDHSPSAMRGRDGPAPPRPEDYSGWSGMADDRRRSASLIPLTPEMTANAGRVTISWHSRMRPALAAGASREQLALLLVALHHGIRFVSRSNFLTSLIAPELLAYERSEGKMMVRLFPTTLARKTK